MYQYLARKTLKKDLESFDIKADDKAFVAFCVNLDDSLQNQLWKMPELWHAWLDYYLNDEIANRDSRDVCYVSCAENSVFTEKHPKSINRSAGNAKLISGNDSSNFTFRGRFETSSQAVTVSYEVSQKAHQALRWLIAKSSCYKCDSQAIVAWAIDNNPEVLPFYDDSYGIYNSVPLTPEVKLIQADTAIYVDYARELKRVLHGYSGSDKIGKHSRRIAIMSTDAATTGRLSITYYRELFENEYEERIIQWHDTCKWYQPFEKSDDGTYRNRYFIGAPSFNRIALAVLGKPRKNNDSSYNKLVKSLREQLVHCVFDGERVPLSMVVAAIHRASNPLALEKTGANTYFERWRDWECVLGATCALIKRYYHDYEKEEYAVDLEPKRDDRDYLYGRLLAVADRIETVARYKQGKIKDDDRATNALRYMTAFAQHPFRTWNMLFTQLLNPYIQQLNGAVWYLNLISEIIQLFKPNEFENDAPLDGRYLLGFFTQRQEFRKKMEISDKGGEEDNELEQ